MNLPQVQLASAPASWGDQTIELSGAAWRDFPVLPPLILADGSGPAQQQTSVRLCADSEALYVRFDCDDRDIWATYTRRDDPLYDEEVVELFISPGEATPTRYYEFEVSPTGVLFDAQIDNPTGRRTDIVVDPGWDCDDIRWQAGRNAAAGEWWAILAIPWAALTGASKLPAIWRANFYRIERPHGAEPEFSCWSPTLTEPADFHKPAYFGTLLLAEPHANH